MEARTIWAYFGALRETMKKQKIKCDCFTSEHRMQNYGYCIIFGNMCSDTLTILKCYSNTSKQTDRHFVPAHSSSTSSTAATRTASTKVCAVRRRRARSPSATAVFLVCHRSSQSNDPRVRLEKGCEYINLDKLDRLTQVRIPADGVLITEELIHHHPRDGDHQWEEPAKWREVLHFCDATAIVKSR